MTVQKTPPPGSAATDELATEKLVTLTIDGIEVSVPEGTLVIRAAEQVGIQIPRFCDHPLLAPVGACRQCLVDVPDAGNGRGMPKPQASCTMPVAAGMVVNTQRTSPVADKAQQGVMELLLINHPLDCPVCDKGGECPLQNQAMSNGREDSRFEGVKRTFPKPIHLSPQVLLDRERCIVCQRCTRFADEIAGDPFIALVQRGAQQQIGVAEDVPFTSYFAGNTIQICPVGALTSADYRFRSRPFDLVSTAAVAEHDACGAAIRVDHRRGKVMRRLSGNDADVNEEWISDKDRFGFAYARAADRLTHPWVRDEDGTMRPASWPEAFAVAARGLRAAMGAPESPELSGGVGVLTGGRLTAEDAYAYGKFARVVLGTHDIDFRARVHSAEEADFLAEHVVLSGPEDGGVSYADLERASTVLLVGLEPEDEAGTIFLRLRKAYLAGGARVLAVAPYASRGLEKMGGRLLPCAPGAEADLLPGLAEAEGLDASSVILVGERLAGVPGGLSAAAELARRTGARLAWVPRRAGDRGAVEGGCLPHLLPGGRPVADPAARVDAAAAWGVEALPSTPGRDGEGILAALRAGELRGAVVAGVDPDDLPDPSAALAALAAADFLVSLELRESAVTALADVVFPVAPTVEKSGTFLTWEGRVRPFETVLTGTNALPDLRVLAGISEEWGAPLGFRTTTQVRAEMADLGAWEGPRAGAAATAQEPAAEPAGPSRPTGGGDRLLLATHKQMIDLGRMTDGAEELRACARPAVVRLSPATAQRLGLVTGQDAAVTGDRGTLTLPVEVGPMVDDVAWVPAHAVGRGALVALSSPGGTVTVKGALQ